jgi:hypothetical protein
MLSAKARVFLVREKIKYHFTKTIINVKGTIEFPPPAHYYYINDIYFTYNSFRKLIKAL